MVYHSRPFPLRPEEKKMLYNSFKEDLCQQAQTVDMGNKLENVKLTFLLFIRSRRRLEHIKTLPQLIYELERCKAIDPEAGRIQHLELLARKILGEDHDLLKDFKVLLRDLSPVAQEESQLNTVASDRRSGPAPIPEKIVKLVAATFDKTKGGSKDWEHLATGLGYGLEKRDEVRLLQGEVDNIERQETGGTAARLRRAFRMFESRCGDASQEVNLVAHVADLLTNQVIFDPPLTRLAKEIKNL